jgi:hypothetical protein
MKSVAERLLQKNNYHSRWIIKHWRKDDSGIYRMIWMDDRIDENTLMDTGAEAILSAFFATGMANYGAPPANHYLALDSRVSINQTDTLATMAAAELALGVNVYSRKALSSAGIGVAGQDFYINKPATYYEASSNTVTWTATGNWVTPQVNIDLCTNGTAVADADGKHLVASLPLSTSRLLMNGDILEGSMYLGLSN